MISDARGNFLDREKTFFYLPHEFFSCAKQFYLTTKKNSCAKKKKKLEARKSFAWHQKKNQ